MPPHRDRRTQSLRRPFGVVLLIAVLFANLLAGGQAHFARAAETAAGAIQICSADGGIRYVLPDGSELPAPEAPPHDGHGCPDCTACVHSCGSGFTAASGIAEAACGTDPRAIDSRLAGDADAPRPHDFPRRPPGHAPPLTRT